MVRFSKAMEEGGTKHEKKMPEDVFYEGLIERHFPLPERQARVSPERRWSVDFFWKSPVQTADGNLICLIPKSLAVEIEGGAFIGGRHTRGATYREDIIKYNELASRGIILLRFMPEMVRSGEAYEVLFEAMVNLGFIVEMARANENAVSA